MIKGLGQNSQVNNLTTSLLNINPGNPTSGIKGISEAQMDTFVGIAATEDEMTSSTLTGSGNPLSPLLKMFQFKTALGMLNDFFSQQVDKQNDNKKLSKGTQSLAKGAIET